LLTVQTLPRNETRLVVLQDDWVRTDVRVGDILNVIGTFCESNNLPSSSSTPPIPAVTITSKDNLLIVHPDILITATALSNAPQCLRKPLLSSLVRSTSSSSDITPSLVWGNILHEVMQTCMVEETWDDRFIEDKIEDAVRRALSELLRIGIGVEQAVREVQERARGLKGFRQKYVSRMPKPDGVLTNTRALQGQSSLLAISGLHDIEEDIWSPTYGLKGKLDASVQAVISDTTLTPWNLNHRKTPNVNSRPATSCPPDPQSQTQSGPLPFEIKTGRTIAGMEHRAQTMLYTLLMEDRYKREVKEGLLYYTQSEEVVRVPRARNEIRGLIIARNELAGYMKRRMGVEKDWKLKKETVSKVQRDEVGDVEDEPFLPPTIDDSRTCGRCFVLDTCMLYRKAVENVDDTDSPIADIYALKTSHLTPTHTTFFKHWESLIALEEQDILRFRKELWTLDASEREQKGRCFSEMVLDPIWKPDPEKYEYMKTISKKEGKIHQFTYRFTKLAYLLSSLLNGHVGVGDAVTVSIEPGLLAFVRGFILDLTPYEVIVGVDHEIDLGRIRERIGLPVVLDQDEESKRTIFRIDKDELSRGLGRIRDNLAQLFYVDGDTKRLELVVDLREPKFSPLSLELSPPDLALLTSLTLRLNDSQRRAMHRVLDAEDYCLILGMPGTGKTTVVATLIKVLVGVLGKTVLLSSYTHSAVDNILLKLKESMEEDETVGTFGTLRLGNMDKIHPDIHQFTLSAKRTATSIEMLESQVMTPPVVATTCLSIDQKFDYCILDEASQVRNYEARKGGMDVSLFRRLSEAHPSSVVELTQQYRMNQDIMLLSNKLIYGDRLSCGSEAVANRSLLLPDGSSFLKEMHAKNDELRCGGTEGCWIQQLLDASCKAVFVDTDSVPAHDSRVGDLVQNVVEARLVHQLAETLIRSGIEQEQIGVLSLYRQQIKLLSYLLQDRKGVEILTADRSQGRDKDCIIISLVRSNDIGQIGDLVKDWRRMNVSFTRARSKLIIFGSRSTLQDAPLLKEFFQLMDSQHWIIRLPPNADQMHDEYLQRACLKRSMDEDEDIPMDVSDEFGHMPRSIKKARCSSSTPRLVATGEEGLLTGRPILKDLMNERKGVAGTVEKGKTTTTVST
ncbi:DNA replication factor Dna2-domain-containing protein, partial [Abortiporus biennis]